MKPVERRAILSLHDVMPETLERVDRILDLLARLGHPPVPLLVVPGRDWDEAGMEKLRRWEAAGHSLVAHGWRHHVAPIRGWRHRLHSAVLSRDVAEHLALDEAGIVGLMTRSRAWFGANGLRAPDLYVPPAWALGRVRASRLGETGFAMVEAFRGVYLTGPARWISLPVAGFEARGSLSALVLGGWNRWQLHRTTATRPLRISIHPYDPEFRLATQLDHFLRLPLHWAHYPDL